MRYLPAVMLLTCALASAGTPTARAGVMTSSIKENFNSLFLTAAYSTVLGAALGGASLAFSSDPHSKIRYIPIGAAVGFMSGTLLGTYFIISPSFSRGGGGGGGKGRNDDDLEGFSQDGVPPQKLGNAESSKPYIAFYPVVNLAERKIESWRLNWTIATF